ncbi:MAG: 4Fe-4S binding protein, partial [Halapricum sp.]
MSVDIARGDCTACGTCVEICPANVFEMGDDGPIVADPDACTSCGVCADQCPTDAITVEMARDVAGSTGEFETEERYREWSRTLRETLDLERRPVAITLLEDADRVPEG